jgi:hypothetical protein
MFESPQRGVLRIKNGLVLNPISIQKLSKSIAGCKPRMIQELIDNGVIRTARKDGAFYSKRLIRDELKRRHKAKSGQKGGKQSRSKAEANYQAKRGSSTSTSTSTSPSGLNNDNSYKDNNCYLVRFDYEMRKIIGLKDEDYHQWQEAFPAVDIPTELKSATQWLVDNPTKRKKQVRRFLTNWFRRTQERGGSHGREGFPKTQQNTSQKASKRPKISEQYIGMEKELETTAKKVPVRQG